MRATASAASSMSLAKTCSARRVRHPCRALCQQDRQRIGLLPGRAAGHPDPHRVLVAAAFEQRPDDMPVERREGLGVTEEAGHADQQVAEQQGGLVGRLPEMGDDRRLARRSAAGPSAAGPGGRRSCPCSRRNRSRAGCAGPRRSPTGPVRSRPVRAGLRPRAPIARTSSPSRAGISPTGSTRSTKPPPIALCGISG